jgi:UDP-N-acetylglucosamine 2-epimerase (non-hydrolysing)
LKILTVFGTRPEAIKLAPIIAELGRRAVECGLESRVCVTAQHREMLDQVLQIFGIVPDYDLDLMKDGQSLTEVASAVLSGLEPILEREKPDWVLVQGDTTTVVAASLAAFYAGVRLGHVEAGLRTHDKWQPFPEEINRRLTGVMADFHFAPTAGARLNLLRENVPDPQIRVTGNPVIDALHWVVRRSQQAAQPEPVDLLDGFDGRLLLVTAHRRENFGAPLANICLALQDIAEHYGGQVRIAYPVHPNPSVSEPVYRLLGDVPDVMLVPPLDYLSMIRVMQRSCLVLTDSGGLQEEAPGLGKPVLVLRDVTERPEAVEAGTVRLVGTDRRRIVEEAVRLLDHPADYNRMAQAVNPYGDGHAAERIVSALLNEPSQRPARRTSDQTLRLKS